MAAIEKIEIKGFKAFPTKFELNLEGKHLLMYGENGSGKSSIYFALHCLYQSSLKPDAGKKYFNILNEDGSENPQHLLNRNRLDEDAEIKVTIQEEAWAYTIDKNGCTPELMGGRRAHFPLLCCFINHNFISRFFNFRNSETINLFPVFIKDILSFCFVPEYKLHISEMYDYLTTQTVPTRGRAKTLFELQIESFNQETKRIIEDINLVVSERYNKYFKDENDRDLQIRLRYDSNKEKLSHDTNEYWLKYDNILEEQIIQGVKRVRRSPYKKWNNPFIGLEVSEKMDDGTYSFIPKPQTYFNEAKLTAIALSIRFALLNLDKPADGRFLALDDMLISLDMSNRAKVVDFLLTISNQYKIYLFTHDLSFFKYFACQIELSKVKVEEWMYLKLYMNPNTQSPTIIDEDWNYESKAKRFFQISDYESCAVFLRKELEVQVSDRLPFELKTNASGGFIDLQTLWDKLITFYSKNGNKVSDEICHMFALSKLLILNPAAHYQRLSTPIFRSELINAFRLLGKIKRLKKIERKLLIPKGTIIEFNHPTKPYYCRFELKTDLILETGDHIVAVIPKCKDIYWEYNSVKYYNFETGKEDKNNPLIKATPRLIRFILNMPEEIRVTEDDFISNCLIEGNKLDDFLCGIKFSQMVKA